MGDGFLAYNSYLPIATQTLLKRSKNPHDDPKASAVGLLVLDKFPDKATHLSNFLPLSLRASEAEEVKKGIKFQPLV